jgi:hypothetical protein
METILQIWTNWDIQEGSNIVLLAHLHSRSPVHPPQNPRVKWTTPSGLTTLHLTAGTKAGANNLLQVLWDASGADTRCAAKETEDHLIADNLAQASPTFQFKLRAITELANPNADKRKAKKRKWMELVAACFSLEIAGKVLPRAKKSKSSVCWTYRTRKNQVKE